MAQRIENYQVRPPEKIGPDAHDELHRLLETLHQRGLLRLANDLAGADTQVARVLVEGLNKEGTLNALQNLSILGMALSRIPPEDFYKVVFALRDGFGHLAQARPGQDEDDDAPGIRGTWKMLQDDELWHGLTPLIDAVKVFAHGLERNVERPISAFSGKRTEQ